MSDDAASGLRNTSAVCKSKISGLPNHKDVRLIRTITDRILRSVRYKKCDKSTRSVRVEYYERSRYRIVRYSYSYRWLRIVVDRVQELPNGTTWAAGMSDLSVLLR